MKPIFILVVLVLAAATDAAPRSTEFVTQVLEPTGGKIPRPKDWFYAESHHGPVYDWIISREDTHSSSDFKSVVRTKVIRR